MTVWIDVCHIDDLQSVSGVCALLEGQQVALFLMAKTQAIYAVGNFDPIAKANVMSRGMIGDLGGEPMVASPMYKQHFNLKTGVCFEYPDVKLKTYPVRIDNHRIAIKLEAE
jgi:nitrite reductase (NADH) small subunit